MNLKEMLLRIPPKIISQTRALNVATLRNINEKEGQAKRDLCFQKTTNKYIRGTRRHIIGDSLPSQNADNTHHYNTASACPCILWHPWLVLGGSSLLILLHDRMSRIQLSQ